MPEIYACISPMCLTDWHTGNKAFFSESESILKFFGKDFIFQSTEYEHKFLLSVW